MPVYESLCTALEMTKAAHEFYYNALSSCSDTQAVRVLDRIEKEKSRHVTRIQSLTKIAFKDEDIATTCALLLNDESSIPSFSDFASHFADSGTCSANTNDIIDKALEIELELIAFYQTKADTASSNEAAAFFVRMTQETKAQYMLLADLGSFFSRF